MSSKRYSMCITRLLHRYLLPQGRGYPVCDLLALVRAGESGTASGTRVSARDKRRFAREKFPIRGATRPLFPLRPVDSVGYGSAAPNSSGRSGYRWNGLIQEEAIPIPTVSAWPEDLYWRCSPECLRVRTAM